MRKYLKERDVVVSTSVVVVVVVVAVVGSQVVTIPMLYDWNREAMRYELIPMLLLRLGYLMQQNKIKDFFWKGKYYIGAGLLLLL